MNSIPFVRSRDIGEVRWLTLNRPERKNAVPIEGWDEIAEALSEAAESPQRVVVISGEGGNFCSGADLNVEQLDDLPSPMVGRDFMRGPGRAATILHNLPKPSIAAVDGVAVGAGMNLAIGCDIVVATSRARFGEVFVNRGLSLDFGGTWLLPRLVGTGRARELALTGRIVDALEASQIGLITRMVEVEELESAAINLADQLASGAPMAQRFIKTALSRSMDMTFEQAISYEEQAQATLLASADLREGVDAFLEKRTPRFSGR